MEKLLQLLVVAACASGAAARTVTCTFTIDNSVHYVDYANTRLRIYEPTVGTLDLNNWGYQKRVQFTERTGAELWIAGSNADGGNSGCSTGGLAMKCTTNDGGGPWHNIWSNTGMLRASGTNSLSTMVSRFTSKSTYGMTTPCSTTSGFYLPYYTNAGDSSKHRWPSNGNLYAIFRIKPAAINCGSGHVRSNDWTCSACPGGKYNSGTNGSCSACPTGRYQNSKGQSSCKSCSNGSYQNSSGQTGCKTCGKGTYSVGSYRTGCTSCAKGKYQGSTGKTGCSSCAKGKYQGSTGKTSCSSCAKGKYQGSTGQTSCSSCAKGKYQGSTGKDSCSSCAKGKYQGSTGKESCSSCAKGKYQGSTGKDSCSGCATGNYQDSTGQASCKSCGANAHQTADKAGCACDIGFFGDGYSTCTDKCTMDLADEMASSFESIKQNARGKSKGAKIDMSGLGIGNMDRCSPAQKRKKRKQAFDAVMAEMKASLGPGEKINMKLDLSEASMPAGFNAKADGLGLADLNVRETKVKTNKSKKVGAKGNEVCEEADVDLRQAGAYDVVLDAVGDEAIVCRGKRPVTKLEKVGASSYKYYCWVGRRHGSFDAGSAAPEGSSFTCPTDPEEFFVESLAVVSDGGTDAPTSAPTLAPTESWYFMNHGEVGQVVQCAGPNQIQCASDDGLNCNNYTGTPFEAVLEGVSNDSPIVLPCPAWTSPDGEFCHELDCYVTASQMSDGPSVDATDYNMGIDNDDDSVYKCNHGHRKCMVSTVAARSKFVEIDVAEVPPIIMVPAEDFSASAADGNFTVVGNEVVYTKADNRLEHYIPFANSAQQ